MKKWCYFYVFLLLLLQKVVAKTLYFGRKVDLTMNEQEKRLLQAKHRAEEAAARDRVKERKARTRRLIQEGAILEKAFPKVCDMELEDLSLYLTEKLK